MLKKVILASVVMMSAYSQASDNNIFCYKTDKVSEEGYSFNKDTNSTDSGMCVMRRDNFFLLNENSHIYGINNYEITNAPSDLVENTKSIQNISGKLILITKSNELYTADLGYVLNNNDYLPLKTNNKITLEKEKMSNVEKVIYSDVLLVLTKDKKVFIKTEKNEWERAPFKSAIDMGYTNYGSYFVLTKGGVFAKLKESDLQKTNYKGKGSLYKFDKAELGAIPLSDLRFDYIENKNTANYTKLNFTNVRNKNTYEVYLLGNKAYFNEQPTLKEIPHVKQLTSNTKAKVSLPIVEARDLEVKEFIQLTESVDVIESVVLSTNKVLTRYNEWVTLPYKEDVYLIDRSDKWGFDLVGYEDIVSVKENIHKDLIYVLRADGHLRIYERSTLLKVAEDVDVKALNYSEWSEEVEIIK